MKTRFIIYAAAICLSAFMSCQKVEQESVDITQEEASIPVTPSSDDVVVFSASTGTPVSRTSLSDNLDDTYTVLWSSGDAIYVNGRTLTLQTVDQPSGYGPGYTRGNFAGLSPIPSGSSPLYTAYYPATLRSGAYFALPSSQTYVADNINAFPMYAESDGDSFTFHNLCGIIRIGLKGDTRSVSSITLADADASPKPMSGRFTVSSNTAVMSSGTAGTSLVCSPAVTLATDEFTYFNITVPAATYGKLRIIVEATDGYLWTLTSKNGITVERSKITPINLSSPNFRDTRSIITYTTTNGAAIDKFTAGDDASVFGDGLKVYSHEYTDGLGTISLDGTVTRIGDDAFNNKKTIRTITIPNTVTSIGSKAFYMLSNMTSCNIPSGVTSIGDNAFYRCSSWLVDASELPAGLSTIGTGVFNESNLAGDLVLNDAVTSVGSDAFKKTKITSATIDADIAISANMFNTCTSLETVEFNGACPSIGENAFYDCTSLTGVEIPNSVTSIGIKAFQNCSSLKSATLSTNASFTTVPANCFDGCSLLTSTTIPSNITHINNYAFKNCGFTSLPSGWGRSGITYGIAPYQGCPIESITFPDTWTSIPNYFCQDLTSLEEVVLGSSITNTGVYTFNGCTSLTDVTLNSGLLTLGNFAFKGCALLSSLTIPATVTTIGQSAFENCAFTSLPSGMKTAGVSYGTGVFKGCPIVSLTIPDSWTTIPAQMFKEVPSLETLVLGSGISTVGNYAFSDCTSLSSVTLQEGVTSLGLYAFYGCSSLASISLPSTVNTIGNSAFSGSGLTALPAGLRSDISFGSSVFYNTKMTDVTIPDGMTTVPESMFSHCALLESVDLNDATVLNARAFQSCTSLTSVTADEVVTLKDEIFSGCSALGSISLPKATSLAAQCFINCSGLSSISIPLVETISTYVFRYCTSLSEIHIPSITTIGGAAFWNCSLLETFEAGSGLASVGNCFGNNTSLTTVIIRATSVPTCTNTKLNDSGSFLATIYVPADSVEDYKGAAVWSNHAASITAIAD